MMETLEQHVRNVMIEKGASPFWADSAMRWIESAMNTNTYFTKGVSHFKLALNKELGRGVIRTFSFDALMLFPDTDKEATARLTYTFNKDRKMAHKVELSFYSAPANP